MSDLTPGESKALDNLASVPGTWLENAGPLKYEEFLMLAGYRAAVAIVEAMQTHWHLIAESPVQISWADSQRVPQRVRAAAADVIVDRLRERGE